MVGSGPPVAGRRPPQGDVAARVGGGGDFGGGVGGTGPGDGAAACPGASVALGDGGDDGGCEGGRRSGGGVGRAIQNKQGMYRAKPAVCKNNRVRHAMQGCGADNKNQTGLSERARCRCIL